MPFRRRSLNTVLKPGWNGNLKQVKRAYLANIENRSPFGAYLLC
jgi:hypothetical protein